jgi:hypothetical protein
MSLVMAGWAASPALGLCALVFGGGVGCGLLLSKRDARPAVACLAGVGLLAACLKIWLVQLAPQWLDTPPDSQTYMLHAEALAAHWSGLPVEAVLHRLAGLLILCGADQANVWLPDSRLSYASVLGTNEWIYAVWLAAWKSLTPDWKIWAVYGNAALAAFFPVAAYGIALSLGGGKRVAWFAAGLTLLDPSAAVNSAWMLKDTLAGWLLLATIWAALELIRHPKFRFLSIFVSAAAILLSVRYAAGVVVLIACGCVLIPLVVESKRRQACFVLAGMCGVLSVFYISNQLPFAGREWAAPQSILAPMVGAKSTFQADSSDKGGSDSTVLDWQNRFSESPVSAVVKSISRTLFAPYPWVVLTEGVNSANGIELYYPGVVFWILCLPGVFWGFLILGRENAWGFAFIVLILGGLLAGYVLFMGEWSTRQRVFVLPVFFVFAAIGFVDIRSRLRNS